MNYTIVSIASLIAGWEARRVYCNWRTERRQRAYDEAGSEEF